jgi:hypothetical protein
MGSMRIVFVVIHILNTVTRFDLRWQRVFFHIVLSFSWT